MLIYCKYASLQVYHRKIDFLVQLNKERYLSYISQLLNTELKELLVLKKEDQTDKNDNLSHILDLLQNLRQELTIEILH